MFQVLGPYKRVPLVAEVIQINLDSDNEHFSCQLNLSCNRIGEKDNAPRARLWDGGTDLLHRDLPK